MPILEDSTSGINVVGSNDQVFHEVVVSEGESDGRVNETGSITGEATLVRDIGRHFSKRNHDEVANKPDEAVSKEEAKGATSAGVGSEWVRRRLAG